MRLPLLISLSLLLPVAPSARAQFLPPEDFFNSGAHFYLSNNIPEAKERVETGLKIYPDDEKLKKLEALLNQQQQQQQQKQQQQNSQSQQKQQKQSSPDQQSQAEQSDSAQSQKDQEAQAKKAAEQKKAQEQQARAAEQKNGGETNDVTDVRGAHEMTAKEAEHLLDAQKNNEQFLSLKPRGKPEDARRLIKDW